VATAAEFPASLPDFYRRFPDERACFDYLCEVRWPEGFRCHACGNAAGLVRADRRAVQCAKCDRLAYLTAGAVMHRSKQDLRTWLAAAFLMVTDKRGISAVQLQRALGIKRHETAYQLLHKLRAAMVAPQRERLHGTVEVDETYVGGREPGPRGRGALGKHVVIGAVEVREAGPARVRLRRIPASTGEELLTFVQESIDAGSTILTDGYTAYEAVTRHGYRHRARVAARAKDPDTVLPHLHRAFSNLKTWLHGTFHGAVRGEHLQAYLNEFAFRYNRRGNLQAAFLRLLGIGSRVAGPTYDGLYGGAWKHPTEAPGDAEDHNP
jgi:transposase-like protein